MSALQIVLFIAHAIFLLWLIGRQPFFKNSGIGMGHLYAFFVLKIIAGAALIGIYTFYYTSASDADIYRYFNDSVIISRLLYEHPLHWLKVMSGFGVNDPETFEHLLSTMYFSHPEHDFVTNNRFIIRLHVPFNYVTANCLYTNNLWFNFFALAGLVALFKASRPYFNAPVQWLYLPLFLIPSAVFWGSGPLKEQLLICLTGFYVLALHRGLFKQVFLNYALAALCLWVMFAIKPHSMVLLLGASVCLPIPGVNEPRKWLAVGFGALLGVIAAVSFNWHHKACELLINKRNEFVELATAQYAGSYYNPQLYPADCSGLWQLLPQAFVDAVLRPFLWDNGPLPQTLFAIENMLFLGLVIYTAVRLVRFPLPVSNLPVAAFCFCLALFTYLLIGLTVPIMGAVVHYRIMAGPFLLMGVMLLAAKQAHTATNEAP